MNTQHGLGILRQNKKVGDELTYLDTLKVVSYSEHQRAQAIGFPFFLCLNIAVYLRESS